MRARATTNATRHAFRRMTGCGCGGGGNFTRRARTTTCRCAAVDDATRLFRWRARAVFCYGRDGLALLSTRHSLAGPGRDRVSVRVRVVCARHVSVFIRLFSSVAIALLFNVRSSGFVLVGFRSSSATTVLRNHNRTTNATRLTRSETTGSTALLNIGNTSAAGKTFRFACFDVPFGSFFQPLRRSRDPYVLRFRITTGPSAM